MVYIGVRMINRFLLILKDEAALNTNIVEVLNACLSIIIEKEVLQPEVIELANC